MPRRTSHRPTVLWLIRSPWRCSSAVMARAENVCSRRRRSISATTCGAVRLGHAFGALEASWRPASPKRRYRLTHVDRHSLLMSASAATWAMARSWQRSINRSRPAVRGGLRWNKTGSLGSRRCVFGDSHPLPGNPSPVQRPTTQLSPTSWPTTASQEHVSGEAGEVIGAFLTGGDQQMAQLTKRVLEVALEAEMNEHLGYEAHDPEGRNGRNSRNGRRAKTVLTGVGPVEINVPRDRDASFEPVIVKNRQRRLGSIDQIVSSLTAKGLTTGEISAHFAEIYGASVGKDQISRITDAVIAEMVEWQNRPLDRVYPVVFVDALMAKIRDGKVTNRPIYVAVDVTVNGERDILGLWAGEDSQAGEGAKYWQQVLTEIRNRGVEDVLMLVCDGLKGLPASSATSGPTLSSRHASFTCCGTAFDMSPSGLGQARQGPQAHLHGRDRGRDRGRGRRATGELRRDLGGTAIWPSPGCGAQRGRSSRHSCSSTSRSGGSSARPTRSSRSTPATAAR